MDHRLARIPGKENADADRESRKSRRTTEWCFDKNLFHSACAKLNIRQNIDLFASRTNYQINISRDSLLTNDEIEF